MSEATIEYKNSPNESTAYAVSEGQKTKVQLVATPAGDLELADNPNVDTGYLVINGEKHKCALVAEVAGELKLPTSATDDSGYVTTQDGRQHKVKLVANVTGGGGEPVEKTKFGATVDTFLGDVDANGVLQEPTGFVDLDFSGINTIPQNLLANRFRKLLSIKSVNMSDVTKIYRNSCYYTFSECDQLVSVRFDNLETIQAISACEGMFLGCDLLSEINLGKLRQIGDADNPSGSNYTVCKTMFQSCKNLKEVDLGNLEYIYSGNSCHYMFNDCSILENVNLTKLKQIYGSTTCSYMFAKCAIQTIDLSSLEVIHGYHACYYMFRDNQTLQSINLSNLRSVTGGQAFGYFCSGTAITTISFPSLTEIATTTAFQYAFNGCNTLTEIHFRADMQATVEALTDYSKKFDAPTTCTIYFDL